MKNYLSETDLKGYIPELSKLLWATETDYTKQKNKAMEIIVTDLIDKGYPIYKLQNSIELNEDDYEEDLLNATRFVVSVESQVTKGTITLYGANDKDLVGVAVTSLAVDGAGDYTIVFGNTYKYYYVGAGSFDGVFTAYITESNYDLLFAYKWLELILMDSYKEENDQFHLKMMYFRNEYDKKINSMAIKIDTDDDGDFEEESNNTITIKR